MATNDNEVTYVASPTAKKFHADDSFMRGIVGPIGSGKSVASIMEIIIRAQQQEPDNNGFRKTRCAVIRNTKPELKSTTIKTFSDWIPESICPVVESGGLLNGKIFQPMPDGTYMDCEVIFLGLDKSADVRKLLSLEITFFFVNEAKEVAWEIVSGALSRCARYPSQKDRPAHIAPNDWPTFTGGWCDTNPPDTEHWWFENFEEKKVDNFAVFHQPPAMTPKYEEGVIIGWELNKYGDPDKGIEPGENLKYLKPDYYEKLISGQKDDWIRIMVGGEYGMLSEGRPVFPRFTTGEHVSKKPLEIYRGVPLLLGSDNGLYGFTIIAQIDPTTGMLRILREYGREGESIREFVRETIHGALLTEFRGCRVDFNYCDPACNNRQSITGNAEVDEWNHLGIMSKLATTQAPQARITAVASRLEKKTAGILIDPSCKKLIKAMGGDYKFRRVQSGGAEALYTLKPLKNRSADVADALQYLCVSIDEMYRPTSIIDMKTDFVLDETDDYFW